MAIQRYKTEKFATIELNHVSWPETARVFAQLPLDTTDFSNEAPCENGMWVVYDYAGGTVRKAKTADENVVSYSRVNNTSFILKFAVWPQSSYRGCSFW